MSVGRGDDINLRRRRYRDFIWPLLPLSLPLSRNDTYRQKKEQSEDRTRIPY